MRILITAGPTREYFDRVRFLSNASSGKMGYAIAQAALAAGNEVELVSGPVALAPPPECRLHSVESTDEMYETCLALVSKCDGVIGAAAVCDYRPRERFSGKFAKNGQPLLVELIETPDILAELGRCKINGRPWIVGFALEAENAREHALRKLEAKRCDAIVLNHPQVIGSDASRVELIDRSGATVAQWQTGKAEIARQLVAWIDANLVRHSPTSP